MRDQQNQEMIKRGNFLALLAERGELGYTPEEIRTLQRAYTSKRTPTWVPWSMASYGALCLVIGIFLDEFSFVFLALFLIILAPIFTKLNRLHDERVQEYEELATKYDCKQ